MKRILPILTILGLFSQSDLANAQEQTVTWTELNQCQAEVNTKVFEIEQIEAALEYREIPSSEEFQENYSPPLAYNLEICNSILDHQTEYANYIYRILMLNIDRLSE